MKMEYLFWPPNYSSAQLRLLLAVDGLFKLLQLDEKRTYKEDRLQEANLLTQKIMTLGISIVQLSEGIKFIPRGKSEPITGIPEPFSILTLIRSLLESVCILHLIYGLTATNKHLSIFMHAVWSRAGLLDRKQFHQDVVKNQYNDDLLEFETKVKNDLDSLAAIEKVIHESVYFEQYRVNIESKRKKKEYKIDHWGKWRAIGYPNIIEKLMENSEYKTKAVNTYKNLTLSAHPSNVSVFQFRDAFKGNGFETLILPNLWLASVFVSLAIRDYTRIFPSAKLLLPMLPKDYISLFEFDIKNHG